MDVQTFKKLLCETPQTALLDAIDNGQNQAVVPLLEAELYRSMARLQRLKEYRNSLASPIYRLQSELLADIFCIYARDHDELFNLKWTRLLLVCSRWHDVAISLSYLWSFIDISTGSEPFLMPVGPHNTDAQDIRRIEMQRSRAGSSPLTIRMCVHASSAKIGYLSMFWSPNSLLSITLTGDHTQIQKITSILAAYRHDILRTLRLHRHSYTNPATIADSQLASNLDVAIQKQLPKLRHLSISDIPFTWANIHGLRSLRIIYYSDMWVSFTLRDIVDTLVRCPELEWLSLTLPSNFQADGSPSLTTSVSLPYLGAVVVEAAADVCASLLQASLDVPASTKVIMSTPGDSSTSAVVSLLGIHASREGAPAIRSLSIRLVSGIISAGTTDGGEDAHTPFSRIDIAGNLSPNLLLDDYNAFSWTHVSAEEQFTYIGIGEMVPVTAETRKLQHMIESWPLSRCTNLDVRLVGEMDPDRLDMLCAGVPTLETIVVRPESATAQALVDFLRTQLQQHNRRIFANIVFDVAKVNHNPGFIGWDGTPRLSPAVRATQNIISLLMYCGEVARAGAPLSTVEIINEPQDVSQSLLGPINDIDWSELYADLQDGFVYQGTLHSDYVDREGMVWSSLRDTDT